jgi:hypothetical protein
VFSQLANEVVVVFAKAYHQGFSTGSTLAEALNYGPDGWSIQGYSECLPTCPGHPIPNAKMEFRGAYEEQTEEKQDTKNANANEQKINNASAKEERNI